MIYQPPFGQSDWSECYNHGRIFELRPKIVIMHECLSPGDKCEREIAISRTEPETTF